MSEKTHYLSGLGIDIWQAQQGVSQTKPEMAEADATVVWQALKQQVSDCQACPLHATRTQTVFGVGHQQADLLVVGEAPGYYEDQQGEPFVGPAGQLLNAELKAIGLSRDSVYIANVLKCRPPENRDPNPDEISRCTQHLNQQIDLLRPKVILALGRYAAHYLLGCQESMARLRGRCHHYGEQAIPLIVSYHPAYLLRAPKEKAKAWQDLQLVQATLEKQACDQH